MTSTLAIAVKLRVSHFVFFTVHELILDIVAFVSPQEIEVSSTSTVVAELSHGAIYLFMTGVVVQALAAPPGNGVAMAEPLFNCVLRGWWYGKSFEKTLWGSMGIALAVGTLPQRMVTFWTLFSTMLETSALPAATASGLLMQLWHLEGTAQSKV